MEFNVIEDKKSRIMFELAGEDHTFCNALTSELWKIKGVKTAAYNIDHPLVGVPKVIVETDTNSSVKDAIKKAVSSLEKENKEFLTKFKKCCK